MSRFIATSTAVVACLFAFFARPESLAQETAPNGRIAFRFQNAKLSSVLEYLSRETGWTFLLDTSEKTRDTVNSQAAKVVITAVETEPVPPVRAIEMLNSALIPFNLNAVRIRETVIIMTADEARKRSFEIFTGSNPDDVPFGDNIITQIIPLQYSDASQIKKEIEDHVLSDKAKLFINVQSNSLILIDTATNVRRFLTLIYALDKQVNQEIVIRAFTLKNADASEVSRVVGEVFEEGEEERRQPRGIAGLIQQFMGRGGQGKEETKVAPGQKVKVSVDPRTNTVVVKATKDSMSLIEKLIEEMDLTPTEIETTFVYRLKNADVENIATILNQVMRSSGTGGRSTGGARNTQAGGGFPFPMMFGGGGGTSGMGGGRGGGTRGMEAIRAGEGTGAAGGVDQIYGTVRVQADKESNSLVVVSNPKNLPLLKKLLDELDMVRAQVLIKVFIAEVTLDDETEMGMEWSWQDDMKVGNDPGSASAWTNFDLTSGTKNQGFRYQILSDNIDVLVRALKRKGKLKVLSAPRILVLDNQSASIQVGREIPRITNSRVTDQGNVINSVQYEQVGISLQVTPHINPDGLVRMEVQPEVSEVAPESEGVAISEGAIAPVFVTSTAQTTVSVKDNHTVILGGLIRDKISVSESKVPIIGDIPLLGLLFNSTNYEAIKTELMVFLTPVVVRNSESLKQLTERETQSLEIMERWMIDRVANDGIPLDRIRKKRIGESLK